MKKLLLLALTLVLTLSLAFTLAACGGDDEKAPSNPDSGNSDEKTTVDGFRFSTKGFTLVGEIENEGAKTKMWVNASTSESITYSYATSEIENPDEYQAPKLPSEADIIGSYTDINTTATISDVSVEGTPSSYIIKFTRTDIMSDPQYVTVYIFSSRTGNTVTGASLMFTETNSARPLATSFSKT